MLIDAPGSLELGAVLADTDHSLEVVAKALMPEIRTQALAHDYFEHGASSNSDGPAHTATGSLALAAKR